MLSYLSAWNKIPKFVLNWLANDRDWTVRYYVAGNPSTPQKTLERLANDYDWFVRRNVAFNPNTPQYIRTYLKIKRFLNYYD